MTPAKAGFLFSLAPGAGSLTGDPDCNGIERIRLYYAAAVPDSFGFTGGRSFATTQADTFGRWRLPSRRRSHSDAGDGDWVA